MRTICILTKMEGRIVSLTECCCSVAKNGQFGAKPRSHLARAYLARRDCDGCSNFSKITFAEGKRDGKAYLS